MNVRGLSLAILVLWAGPAFRAPGQTTAADKKQFDYSKAQAERGDAQAQLTLGSLYASGVGVNKDLTKAAKWHRKAAEQGLARAQLRVAVDYANGVGVKPDRVEAVTWLRRAADQGLAEAQFELGACYATGDGIAENPVEAVKWYRKAAAQNSAKAQHALGNCYFEGDGVTKDIEEGVIWTRKAAEQGLAAGEDSLGMCYAKGKGVTQDYLEAYKWFSLAAAQGDEHDTQAKIDLSMAERAMTPEQIAQGQKLAREFQAHASQDAPAAPGTDAGKKSNTASAVPAINGSNLGFLNVKADDETYDVFLDGAFVGNAPAKLKLAPGLHVIEVKKPGFKDFRKEIKITEGSELSLRAVLEKQ
jgi:TPR repeat protein